MKNQSNRTRMFSGNLGRTSAAATLLVVAFHANAPSLPAQYHQVALNPSSLLFGVLKVESEVPLGGSGWAVEPELAYLARGQRFWSRDYDTHGIRAGLVAKKYLTVDSTFSGLYGFGYARLGSVEFVDHVDEGDRRDQRDFRRGRFTVGLGLGWAAVGDDAFVYGFALGLGRHVVDRKRYTSSGPGPIAEADDDEIFEFPLDVYGRVSMGIRLWEPGARAARDAHEGERALELERLRERVQNRGTGTTAPEMSELELRRLRHRLRNGNG